MSSLTTPRSTPSRLAWTTSRRPPVIVHGQLLHGLADNYPCPPCKPVFQTLMSGAHDVVNVELGKGVHDPKRFKEFVELVNEAASKNGAYKLFLAGSVMRKRVEHDHGH